MKNILLIIFVLAITGCTAVGQSNFTCGEKGKSAGCTAARDVYQLSDGGQNPADKKHHNNDKENSTHSTHNKKEKFKDPVIDTYVTPQLPDKPIPVRTPSRVMRIWVASWEDSDVLIAPGYIYTEIEPRRWVIGKPESATQSESRLYKPLEDSNKH